MLCGILFATPAKDMWSLQTFGNGIVISVYVNVLPTKLAKENKLDEPFHIAKLLFHFSDPFRKLPLENEKCLC